MRETTMIIISRPGFKIRTKADAERFINNCMGSGVIIITANGIQYRITKSPEDRITITERIENLNDIFNPAVMIADTHSDIYSYNVADIVYKLRKHINQGYL